MKNGKTFFVLLAVALLAVSASCIAQPNFQLDSFVFIRHGKQKLYLDRMTRPEIVDTASKPVFIFLYGGGWEAGDRKNNGLAPFFDELLLKGYIVVAIDYRLGIKEAKAKGLMNAHNGVQMYLRAIDMAVEDLYAATRFVLDHASEWKVDPNQIVIAGGSAGATTSIVAEYGVCNESHASGFSGYGAAYLSKQFTEMGVANWFYDYVDGDHIVAATPVMNKRDEIAIFLKQFVREKNDLFLHTIEKSKIPTNLSGMFSIGKDDD